MGNERTIIPNITDTKPEYGVDRILFILS